MLTDKQQKALMIIREHPGLRARQFAEFMWPESNMHRRFSNQGHGAHRGKAAWLCGGSYLGRLRVLGFVKHDIFSGGFILTELGEKELKAKLEQEGIDGEE